MTTWQWNVIMALVRYVLHKEGMLDLPISMKRAEEMGRVDRAILVEAALRDLGNV